MKFAGQLGKGGTELHNLRLTATKVQIGLAVIVLKHGGINRLRPRLRRQGAVDQRLPDGILERPFRPVAHRHADLRAVYRQEKVVLAVRLDTIRRPGPAARPCEVLHAKDRAVVLPCDQVGGREQTPIHHVPVGGIRQIVRGIDVKPSIKDPARGIGGEDVRD